LGCHGSGDGSDRRVVRRAESCDVQLWVGDRPPVLFDFEFVYKVVHVDEGAVRIAQAGFRGLSPRNPVLQCEVHRLCTVESVIESSMICTWPCNDELSGVLDGRVDGDVKCAVEHGRADDGLLVPQKLLASTTFFGE